MKQSKYAMAEYWKTKVSQGELFWSGLFDGQPIRRDSVILSPVILNSNSNQHESAWAIYPNAHSVIGFLKFIFLPTAFIGLITSEMKEGYYYFEEDLMDILDEFKNEYPQKNTLIAKMEKFYSDLNNLWDQDNDKCFEKIKQWSKVFNERWEESDYVSLSFNLFASPIETVNYIIKVYEEDLGIESLEYDIGLSKDQFLALASDDIFENDFLNRRFTDILTNRLNVAF